VKIRRNSLDWASAHARETIALDDALKLLPEVDPHKAQVIELRFFGRRKPPRS
jgi:hypothetical protein